MASQAQYNGNIASMETYNTAASRSKRMAYGFTYDAAERLTGAGNHAYNAEAQRYDATNEWEMPLLNYDAAGNLKLLQRTDSKGDLVDDFRYLYQSGTNRLSETENRASEEVLCYMYDANGNVIRDLSRNLSWIEYDLHNQPISDYNIKDGSGTVYAYGVNGERIRKYSTKRNDTYYVPGADGRTEVILNHPYAKDVTINLWGNDNLGQIRVGPGNKEYRYYYLKDHLGSIRATVDESGMVTSGDDYYPFGMSMDSRTTASGKVDTKLKFTGKERDTETGYDYFGARYYDARIGRFLQIDPKASQFARWNTYNYSYNNPIRFIDPSGMVPGEYYDEEGNFLGNDGVNDKRKYITDQTTIKQNTSNGQINWNGVQTNSGTVLLPSDATRTALATSIQQATSNNEVGGLIGITSDGTEKVINAVPGAAADPKKNEKAEIDTWNIQDKADMKNVRSISGSFHTHPSATVKEGNVTYNFNQPPSTQDYSNAGPSSFTGNSYVFGMRSSTVYI